MSGLVDHLKNRHLDLNLHSHWLDENEGIVVFPLYQLSGKISGWHQYRPFASKKIRNRPFGRYWTHLPNKNRAVWGIDSWYLSNVLFVTEGTFDACRFTELGYSAIATLSNNPVHLTGWFKFLRSIRPVVVVTDPDPAGKKLLKYGHHGVVTPDVDLGDQPEEYVLSLINRYGDL